ncbi:MAG: superoxide dismutase [Patescibacteria group bacterium]|nr:superoxide dismutase [Patescibacteria group bacterium]
MEYKAQKFDIPELEGISTESVKQHIGLYEGYVKNFNAMTKLMDELFKDSEENTHALAEIVRRRSFEFGGMRLHEHYFTQWEGGMKLLDESGALGKALASQFGSADDAVSQIQTIGMMRGPGWSLLYYDTAVGEFRVGFTGEQHMGHFVTLPIILALDVWEHAYILDYGAAGKGKYVDAFFKNLNWGVVEKRFDALQS